MHRRARGTRLHSFTHHTQDDAPTVPECDAPRSPVAHQVLAQLNSRAVAGRKAISAFHSSCIRANDEEEDSQLIGGGGRRTHSRSSRGTQLGGGARRRHNNGVVVLRHAHTPLLLPRRRTSVIVRAPHGRAAQPGSAIEVLCHPLRRLSGGAARSGAARSSAQCYAAPRRSAPPPPPAARVPPRPPQIGRAHV